MEIAGYYANLERGLQAISVPATAVDIYGHSFAYVDRRARQPLPVRLVRAAIRKRSHAKRWRTYHRAQTIVAKALLFVWAVRHFDIFVFAFRMSFFSLRELPILRFLNKRIVFVFHGSDARPPYLDGALAPKATDDSTDQLADLARRMKSEIRWIEKYSHVIIAHPLYAQFLERPFVRFLAIGIPTVGATTAPLPDRTASSAIRVLHAPSDPEVKGSARIRGSIAALRAAGRAIDYVEISGAPNNVVLQEIARADFVIDELYSDTPMATFAAEAAARGRPAIVGSNGWDDIRRLIPAEEAPPVEACHPDRVEAAISRLVADQDYRQDLGRRAREFVAGRWTPPMVAQRFALVLGGEIPDEWMARPEEIIYFLGCGITEDRARTLVQRLVRKHGTEALQLGDKPELERAIQAWAGDGHSDEWGRGNETAAPELHEHALK